MPDSAARTIRFVDARIEHLGDDSCKATVELERRDGGMFVGSARGPKGQLDELRAVARATSDALSEAFDAKAARVRVVNVSVVESLMQTAVLVTLAASRGTDHHSLLGVCDVAEDPARAAALAVLNATNRYLGDLNP